MWIKNNSREYQLMLSHMTAEIAIQQEKNGYKVFCVSNCSQEAGALEVSKELAIHFADMGRRTILINGDVCGLEKASDDNTETRKGFADILEEGHLNKEFLSHPHGDNLYYIERGNCEEAPKEQLVCSPEIPVLLTSMRDMCDILFLVTPSLSAPVSGRLLCKYADAVILVAAIGKTKKEQLESAKNQIDEIETPIAGIIATQSTRTIYDQFIEKFDRQLMK